MGASMPVVSHAPTRNSRKISCLRISAPGIRCQSRTHGSHRMPEPRKPLVCRQFTNGGGAWCPWEGTADCPLTSADRGAAVIELQVWLRLQRDKEAEGEIAVRRVCEVEDRAPIVQVALQRDDM